MCSRKYLICFEMVIVALKNGPYLLNRGSQKVLISAVRDTERFKGINAGLANQSPLMANGQSELDEGRCSAGVLGPVTRAGSCVFLSIPLRVQPPSPVWKGVTHSFPLFSLIWGGGIFPHVREMMPQDRRHVFERK